MEKTLDYTWLDGKINQQIKMNGYLRKTYQMELFTLETIELVKEIKNLPFLLSPEDSF